MSNALDEKDSTTPPPARPWLAPLAELSPAYFGMVMATGIVSLAADLVDLHPIAVALYRLNLGAYLVLWTLTLLRAALYPSLFFRDLFDHLRGPGFFTAVAGTSVLASQVLLVGRDYPTASVLWMLAVALWILLTYPIFAGFTVKKDKPSLHEGINGAWLLAVVATQSIAVLSALLGGHLDASHKLAMNFLALSMWLWGGMLYIWMMSLIFYRYTFFPMSARDLSPPYWINMGAMAISTLAGSLLILNVADAPFLASLLPFLKGFTVLYWATGTWWIPMLVILAVWRHAIKRFPLRYDPLYWGAVFPLGMYAAATHELDRALGFGFLDGVSRLFFWIAMAAWSATFVGLVLDVARRVRAIRA